MSDSEQAPPSEPGQVPADVAALAERISGHPDAPAAYLALHRRVSEGHTSWQDWWASPESEEQGARLLREVITAQLAEVRSLMDLPPREPDRET